MVSGAAIDSIRSFGLPASHSAASATRNVAREGSSTAVRHASSHRAGDPSKATTSGADPDGDGAARTHWSASTVVAVSVR
uniref:hypothetical protein n=1 Tax=Haloplanus natans TaxID=376171 RepID=UPI0012FA3D84|nr:hypothetical protein [Haloplanus natans]